MLYDKKQFYIHLIGVGGVSMRGIAEYFASVGFSVSGSDRSDFPQRKSLEKRGVKVYLGHSADYVKDVHAVIYSDAICKENQEYAYAKQNGIFLISRADALKMISENFSDVVGVAGCHGKTTVTCMLAHIFTCAKLKFSAHIGGEDLTLGNFVLNGNDVFLSEVCEFKKNINKFVADYAVCLNTGVDHMDCYSDETELKNAYLSFAKRGYKSIINANDAVLSSYDGANAVTFSTCKNADVTAKRVKSKRGRYSFDLIIKGKKKGRVKLSVYGRHNVENALSAIACANFMGISFSNIKSGLKNYVGTVRRFENIGKIGRSTVICDYAHHPTEIEASLNCAKEVAKGKVYVLFQPHTYSRTLFLKDEFIKVLKPVANLALYKTFSARENYKTGGGASDLAKELGDVLYFENVDSVLDYYKKTLQKNDILLVLGAGDLYYLLKDKICE
ncbi:MAG: UDP-N-acetylmuramate--L-alanine ligase [Clostridia bacterium]|nr:UDP-N-acetylmuramate--L-alanine ligase [Clostridia bacterium]